MSDISNRLVVAISSRALFNLEESNEVFEQQGVAAYSKYQIAHENEVLRPGVAFNIVKKLLNLNNFGPYVEVVLLSRNNADTGLRIFNSIQHYNLGITRAAFSDGRSPYQYAAAFGAKLFLSANPHDVRACLQEGYAAARICNGNLADSHLEQLRIAFDGDAVLFSDDSERIYQEQGLEAFLQNEQQEANHPLPAGPFRGFLAALQNIQSQCTSMAPCPIRTALITARSAPAHERVIRTLRAWNIRIDEALFLGGLEKGEFLKRFQADIFFDDQLGHCESAQQYVATGHVPTGIKNL